MIKKGFIYLVGFGFVLVSCIKHEVIPAPTPQVDLGAHFIGVINNTQTEYTDNVLGYSNNSFKVKIIQPPGNAEKSRWRGRATRQNHSKNKKQKKQP